MMKLWMILGTMPTMPGWWFGTWILCSPIVGMMIQSDFHSIIFQRGRYTTNQWSWNDMESMVFIGKSSPNGRKIQLWNDWNDQVGWCWMQKWKIWMAMTGPWQGHDMSCGLAAAQKWLAGGSWHGPRWLQAIWSNSQRQRGGLGSRCIANPREPLLGR